MENIFVFIKEKDIQRLRSVPAWQEVWNYEGLSPSELGKIDLENATIRFIQLFVDDEEILDKKKEFYF